MVTEMSDVESKGVLALAEAFRRGEMNREEYWTAMRARHEDLLDYCALIERAGLRSIEVSAHGLYVVLGNGLRMEWHPEQVRVAPSWLLNHGEYEPDELAIVRFVAGRSHVAMDIGANVGWYSLHMALSMPPGGQVYAFEPVPATYDELSRNVHLNGYETRVQPLNLALQDDEGTVQFYVPRFVGSVAASQRQLFPGDNEVVEVTAARLDAWAAQHGVQALDFVKCDVEGSELLVLRGGMETIERYRPAIMLEMLRKWARLFDYHPNDIIGLLRELGYTPWYLEAGRLHSLATMDDECPHTNFFFLHDDKHAPLRHDWDVRQQVV